MTTEGGCEDRRVVLDPVAWSSGLLGAGVTNAHVLDVLQSTIQEFTIFYSL